MPSVVIGLGSNVGDRFENLARALVALRDQIGPLDGLSRIYATAPVGFTDQPEYWNAIAIFMTTLEPLAVFQRAKTIEADVGRVPTFAGGPRIIDLDVILYDDVVTASDRLVIPHPRMHERAFVLRPLAELQPERPHPLTGRTMHQLLHDVRDQRADPLEAESRWLRDRLGVKEESG